MSLLDKKLRFALVVAILLFTFFNNMAVYAADPTLKWSANIIAVDDSLGQTTISPVVVNDTLVVPLYDLVVGVGASNGSILWTRNFTTNQQIYSTPAISVINGSPVAVIADNNGSLVLLDVTNGAIIWNTSIAGNFVTTNRALRSSPFLDPANDSIWLINFTSFTSAVVHDLLEVNLTTGVILNAYRWDNGAISIPSFSNVQPSVVVVNKTLYAANGTNLTAIYIVDGTLNWTQTLSTSGFDMPIYSTPTVISDIVIVGGGANGGSSNDARIGGFNIANGTYIFNATEPNGNFIRNVGGAFANDSYYFTHGGTMSAYNLSGTRVATYSINAVNQPSSTPAVIGDYVFVNGGNGVNNIRITAHFITNETAIWNDTLVDETYYAPIIANSTLFVVDRSANIYAYNIAPLTNTTIQNSWLSWMPFNTTRSVPLIPAIDTTAPSLITLLNESSVSSNSITWQWTNPSDSDFNHVEVYRNETFVTNISSNSTTISSLAASTIYEIEVRPVDNLGNIGLWTNDTAKTNAAPPDTGGNNGGGGGGGSSGPTCKENEIVQNGKCVPKPQNKTTASNQGTTSVNVLPPETTETSNIEPQTSNNPDTSVAAVAPTGFVILQQLKNPYFVLLFAGILFGSLAAYAIHSGKIKPPKLSAPKIPKLSMPKISLPKIKLGPKAEGRSPKAVKFEFPKINLPKFKAPEFSLPKFSMPKLSLPKLKIEKKQPLAAPQTKVVFKPNIFVKTPQIDYKKLARELKPPVEKEIKRDDFLLIPEKLSKIPEMPLDKNPISAPPRSKPIPLNEHMKSLLSGIGETEDEIMRTILMHGGRTTMARIFHETGIPPTTLLRWIVSLENRELIKSTRLGKLRRVELTEKFLKPSP